MRMRSRWLTLALLVPLACTQDDDGTDEPVADENGTDTQTATDTHVEETAETGTTGETGATGCAAETRDDEFAIGLSKSGALVEATFVSADPAPPIKGDNTWVIDFGDLEGQPLADLTIVPNPMMPDHGHGTPIVAVVTALETPGQYEITPVNLFMAGYWQVTFDITLAGGEHDSLMFGFCVE